MDFAVDIPAMYAALGTPAMHTATATNVSTAVNVLFAAQGGGGGIDGLMQGDAPEIRIARSAVGQPRKGDRFLLGVTFWEATAAGVPINDGEEFAVSVRRTEP